MPVAPLKPLKRLSLITVSFSSNIPIKVSILPVKLLHLINTPFPYLTLEFIISSKLPVILPHPLKALSPIDVKVDGNLTSHSKLLHP